MKILKFHYHMEIQFDIPVRKHHFTLKCTPRTGLYQSVESVSYSVFPNRYISESYDSNSNRCIYGFCEEEHDHFLVDVSGIVRTGVNLQNNIVDFPKSILGYQTIHTEPGDALIYYHEKLKKEYLESCINTDKDHIRNLTLFFMHRLYGDFIYEGGITEIETTAEEAFKIGKGVCQDYTHILLSILRMEKIQCRYVTGMMIGEGLSHAWLEVYTGNEWIAVDPTNDALVGDDYISISRGRDYKDCMLNQGIFTGCNGKASQKQDIIVEVSEIG